MDENTNSLSRRRFGKLAGGSAALTGLAGCLDGLTGGGGGANSTFLMSSPLSGSASLPGEQVKKGVELRMAELEAADGDVSVPEGLYENTECSGESAVGVTQNAVSRNSSLFAWVGGYCSPTTLSTMEITRREELLQIVTSSAPAVTESGHPYTLRVMPNSNIVVPPCVDYAIDELDAQRHAVLGINNAWGEAQTEIWRDRAEEAGADVVSFHQVPTDQSNYSNQITDIKSSNPDVIYALGYHGQTANMLSQLRDQGIVPGEDADVFIATIAGSVLTSAAGADTLDSVYAPMFFIGPQFADFPDSAPDYSVEFVEQWRDEYDSDPIRESATGYALGETMVQAMSEVDGSYAENVPEMAEALRNRSDTFQTPLGPIQFDSKGQADLDIFITQHDSDANLHIRQRPQ